MSYTDEVLKFGGPRPYDGVERRTNLSHKTEFLPSAVRTDGRGNIIDMPLLRRKPCFGRPERYFRALPDSQRAAALEDPTRREFNLFTFGGTPCERCPVHDACAAVAFERVDSVLELNTKLEQWAEASERYLGKKRFIFGPARDAWQAFLAAIISSGGWSSVNDGRVAAAAHETLDKRRADRRESALRSRQAKRRHTAPLSISTIDDRLTDAINRESDRRYAILIDMAKRKSGPKSCRRLNAEQCRRLIEVWKAKSSMMVAGNPHPRHCDIISWLKHHTSITDVQEQSLPTIVSRAIERVAELQQEVDGTYIWPPFCPFTAAGLIPPLFFPKC